MVLTATLLTILAILVCLRAAQAVSRAFGLDPLQTLLWLGLAEIPPEPVSRRRR